MSLPLFVGKCYAYVDIHYYTAVLNVLSSFAIISLRKRQSSGCFTLIVFLLSCVCWYWLVLTLILCAKTLSLLKTEIIFGGYMFIFYVHFPIIPTTDNSIEKH